MFLYNVDALSLFFFPCCAVQISSIMLNRSGESERCWYCIVPELRGKHSVFHYSTVSAELFVGPFIIIKIPFLSILLNFFFPHERVLDFIKFFFFCLLIWSWCFVFWSFINMVNYIEFQILNQTCFPGIPAFHCIYFFYVLLHFFAFP